MWQIGRVIVDRHVVIVLVTGRVNIVLDCITRIGLTGSAFGADLSDLDELDDLDSNVHIAR